MISDWPSLAACRNGDPDALFVKGAEQNVAKRICRGCPVKLECLADALDNRIEFGVWGGMTERERRALLRGHPSVASWKRTFEAAQQQAQEKLVPAAGSAAVGQVSTLENATSTTEPSVSETPAQPAGSNTPDSSHVVAATFHIQPENPVV